MIGMGLPVHSFECATCPELTKVLLRKLPKDEWDVNFENLSGANISERVEDGTQVLRENQAESKFQALSKKTRLSAEEADKAAIGVEESDEDKQEDSDHQPTAPHRLRAGVLQCRGR